MIKNKNKFKSRFRNFLMNSRDKDSRKVGNKDSEVGGSKQYSSKLGNFLKDRLNLRIKLAGERKWMFISVALIVLAVLCNSLLSAVGLMIKSVALVFNGFAMAFNTLVKGVTLIKSEKIQLVIALLLFAAFIAINIIIVIKY